MASSTYTPTISFGGNSTGVTYGTQYGRYEQVGDIVYVSVVLQLTSKGSSTGNVAISLPVQAGANSTFSLFPFQADGITFNSGYTSGVVEIDANSTAAGLGQTGSGKGYTGLTDSNLPNNPEIFFTGFYFTA